MTSLRYSNFLCPLGIVIFSIIVSSVDRYMLRCAVCAGLCWAELGWAGLGCAVLCCAVLCCAVLCCAVLCHVVLFVSLPCLVLLLIFDVLAAQSQQPAACTQGKLRSVAVPPILIPPQQPQQLLSACCMHQGLTYIWCP